jgi:type I restriction enzyme S subunit
LPKPGLDADFLFWWLKANRKQIDDLGNGATFKEVSKAVVSRVPFRLPPVDEQRRIAAILDRAEDIRRKREQALAQADDFVRSVFLEMFGDPIVNAKGLRKQPLGKFGKIVTGNTPPRSDADNFGDAIEWIKSDNVNTEEHFLTRAVEGLSVKGRALGRIVPKGSILVTCIAGSPSSIGRAAIADRAVAFNQQINAITPNRDVNLYFLYAQFLIGKPLVLRSSTNSMKGVISKGEFQKIEFLCPEPNEQERFGKLFEKHVKATKFLQVAANCAADLFNTLSQRAFRGEL